LPTYCPGYGINAATQAQCTSGFNGSGGGTHRAHTNSAQQVAGDANRLGYLDNGNGQNWASIDSGATCFFNSGPSVAITQKALGPLGYFGNPTCRNYLVGGVSNGWGATRLDAVAPAAWRDIIYDILTSIGTVIGDPFDTDTSSAYPSYPNGGAAPAWSWSAGFLQESNGSGHFFSGGTRDPSSSGIAEGATRFLNQVPIFDGYVNVRFNANSLNVASVIIRGISETSYYKLEIDPLLNQARIIRRFNDVYQVLSQSTLPAGFSWSNSPWITLGVVGTGLYGYVDFVNLASTNVFDSSASNITAGLGGLEVVAMPGVQVLDFQIVHW
jgi:hypothetical protein